LIGVGVGRFDGINGNYGQREHLAGARDVLGALAAGEQAIGADAMEACGQHVHEKAADELVGGKRHHLIARATFEPVVRRGPVQPIAAAYGSWASTYVAGLTFAGSLGFGALPLSDAGIASRKASGTDAFQVADP
jgi:hypothetical protein